MCSEQISHEIQVQDAYTRISATSCATEQLVDLKDAYFHIAIYPPHRKYLRFAFQGVCENRVLPFGLSLNPRVFVLCTEAAIAPLRRQGIRMAMYLDDWLILAQSKEEAETHIRILLRHLRDLGFMANREKSMLSSAQEAVPVSTDAMMGWGGVYEGRTVRGAWSANLQRSHISFLELSAVFLFLKRFLPFLRGHHVLVRMDNTTTVSYISHH